MEQKEDIQKEIVPVQFAHLHVHSHFSLYDGLSKIDQMVSRAKELGFPGIALTDHGKLCGLIKFYRSCIKHKIKPICGCEFYLVENLNDSKSKRHHLTVLSKNYKGYENLLKLSTFSHQHMSYGRPRIDFKTLSEHSEGLIVLSGCIVGQYASKIVQGEIDVAEKIASDYKEVFGDDYYLEVMWTGYKPQLEVIKGTIGIAKNLDIKIVSTNDVHYVYKEDAETQPIKISIYQNKPYIDSENTCQYYMKSYDEMSKIFKNEKLCYLHNTAEIADKVNVNLKYDTIRLPNYDIPKDDNEFINFKSKLWGKTEQQAYLMYLSEKGLKNRGLWEKPEYRERLEKELETIRFAGFDNYLLIVKDFCDWARTYGSRPDSDELGIAIGSGRGSIGGCLTAYCLEIINGIDPIEHELSMDRFLYAKADYRARIDDFFNLEKLESKLKTDSSCVVPEAVNEEEDFTEEYDDNEYDESEEEFDAEGFKY